MSAIGSMEKCHSEMGLRVLLMRPEVLDGADWMDMRAPRKLSHPSIAHPSVPTQGDRQHKQTPQLQLLLATSTHKLSEKSILTISKSTTLLLIFFFLFFFSASGREW